MPSTIPQAVDARLTRAAIFLVVTLDAGTAAEAAVRSLCADLSALVRGVGFRALDGGLSCVMGIGSAAWDRLFGTFAEEKETVRYGLTKNLDQPYHPVKTVFHEWLEIFRDLRKQVVTYLFFSQCLIEQFGGIIMTHGTG